MKLTPKTITVLKNFYNINTGICFKPGDVLNTVSASRSILAKAKVDVSFARKFCIYDLSRFLHTVGLFYDPEITVNERSVDISDKSSSVTYVCAAENLIAKPTDKSALLALPEVVPYHFNLTNADMQQLFKAMSILGLPEVAVVGDGTHLMVKGIDSENHVADTYTLTLGTTDKTFKAIFNIDNLNKLLLGDYEVKIDKVLDDEGAVINVSHFKNLTEDIEYWIVVSSQSQL